jgi:hypothetical protein
MLVAFHLPRLAVNEGKEMWDLCSVEHEISPRSVIGARKIVQMSHRHVDRDHPLEINKEPENITRFLTFSGQLHFQKKEITLHKRTIRRQPHHLSVLIFDSCRLIMDLFILLQPSHPNNNFVRSASRMILVSPLSIPNLFSVPNSCFLQILTFR